MKTKTTTEAAAPSAPSDEPRNVAVTVLQNRTKIGNAICAAGRCDFAITASQAKALEQLGKVRIDGIIA